MVAKIKVVDNPYYALTRADGSFRIANVPPGTYRIGAWSAFAREFRSEVTVPPAGTASLFAEVVEESVPPRHLRKDRTPYGRYK
jgi:hypothetical protein